MHKSTALRLGAITLLALPATLWSLHALAAPSKRAKTRLAAISRSAKPKATTKTAPLPRYVSIATIKKLQAHSKRAAKQTRYNPLPVLQPHWEGHALKTPMRDLLSGPTPDLPPVSPKIAKKSRGAAPLRLAQRFPRPIAPASPRQFQPARPVTVTPKWVRYPLEFQLAGIGIGTRAVDKDRFNRIDRYGLFALHGNPTAVVRQIDRSFITGRGATAGDGGGGDAGGTSVLGSLTLQQTPPETAALFPNAAPTGGLPDWALAVTVKLDDNHVQWLYKRDNYSMGFVVDRLGFVDAIIVAGLESDITRTQLEDPVHTVKLGDDLRKVMFRYGYPDDIVPLANEPESTARNDTGAVRDAGGGGAAGGAGGGAAAGGGSTTSRSIFTGPDEGIAGQTSETVNATFRTYDLRYEQSYNVVFTIRNNRVIRIYIFGDPDFFNAQRRNQLRRQY